MSDYNNGNQGPWTQGPGGQNQYPGGPGAPDPMRQDQPRPRNGYATVSMICGIFGILLSLIHILGQVLFNGHLCHMGRKDLADQAGPLDKCDPASIKIAVSYTHLDVYKRQLNVSYCPASRLRHWCSS